jgi:hypothetical protein
MLQLSSGPLLNYDQPRSVRAGSPVPFNKEWFNVQGMMLVVMWGVLAGAAPTKEKEKEKEKEGPVEAGGAMWSVGAGAGVTLAGNNANNPRNFVPRASVEYLIGDDMALVVGAFGSFGVSWAGGAGSQLDGGVGANFGMRKYFTSAGKNRLSMHGLFNAGWRDSAATDSSIEVGLGAGFAVDHQLADALTLRALVDVANLGYGRSQGANRIGLDLFLAPALELRLAF